MKKRKKSFREQLMFAIVIFICISLVFYMIIFQVTRGIIVKQYSEAAVQSVNAVGANIDYSLQDVENLSNSIISNRELFTLSGSDDEQFLSGLNSYYVSSFSIAGIYINSAWGYQYVGANIKNGQQLFPTEQLKSTSGEIIWFPTEKKDVSILSGVTEKDYFSMGRKIVDVNSLQELGYLKIELDESILQEAYRSLNEKEGSIYVFDQDGEILSSSQEDASTTRRHLELLSDQIGNKNSSGYLEYEDDNTDLVAIYSFCNNNDWRLVKTIPKAVLYKDMNQFQKYFFLGEAFFLAITMAAAYIYSKKITSPITKMIGQMKEVEEGNLKVRVHTDVNYELENLGEHFNHMIVRVEELMDEVVMVERNKNEIELEVLHAQINPHFLYNTLNTIRWMAKIKGEDSISDAIVALVKLLRVSISLGHQMITFREELTYIENYLVIQRLRFNQQFEISYQIEKELEEITIPKLILQPIVENSLIYGIDEVEEKTGGILKIKIYTVQSGNSVNIIIEDNGPGIDKDTLRDIFKEEKNINKFSSVGLNNVNQRLKMYFGDAYGMNIISEVGVGTKVVIQVPVNIP